MAVVWKEEYATGVQLLDEQHQVLFNNLNKFEKMITSGSAPEMIEKLFVFLEKYAHKHFTEEEKYMEQYQCPVAQQNKEAHQRFVMMLDKFSQRFRDEGADEVLLEQIHSALETWLLNHVCDIDVNLRDVV